MTGSQLNGLLNTKRAIDAIYGQKCYIVASTEVNYNVRAINFA